jgi:hypothetical protein
VRPDVTALRGRFSRDDARTFASLLVRRTFPGGSEAVGRANGWMSGSMNCRAGRVNLSWRARGEGVRRGKKKANNALSPVPRLERASGYLAI